MREGSEKVHSVTLVVTLGTVHVQVLASVKLIKCDSKLFRFLPCFLLQNFHSDLEVEGRDYNVE